MDGLPVREHDDRHHRRDDRADRRHEAERRDPSHGEDAQDLLGGVRHRGQRVRRQHGEPGDTRETLVMREMGRNGCADHEALELPQKRLVGHGNLQTPTGLADGLEIGVLYRTLPDAPRTMGPPYRLR